MERTMDGELLVDRWTIEDGLPLDHIVDITQDEEGFLWLATFDGLVRFDGLEFTVLRRTDLPDLPSNRVARVEALGGDIWMLTERGQLACLRDGEAHQWDHVGAAAHGLRFERWGDELWFPNQEGLVRILDGEPVRWGGDILDGATTSVAPGNDGGLWVSREEGLPIELGADGSVTRMPMSSQDGLPVIIRDLSVDATGQLWVAADSGIFRYDGRELHPVLDEHGEPLPQGLLLVGDESGALWALASNAWWSIERGDATLIPGQVPGSASMASASWGGRLWTEVDGALHADGERVYPLPAGSTEMFVDRNEHLWIATNGEGLLRLRPAAVKAIRGSDEVPVDAMSTVVEDLDGGIVLGTGECGLVRFADGEFTRIVVEMGDPIDSLIPHAFRALHRDQDGVIAWSDSGLCRIDGDRCRIEKTRYSMIRAMLEDSRGEIWLGGPLQRGRWEQDLSSWWTATAPNGEPVGDVTFLVEAPDGSVLAGTTNHGLVRVQGDRIQFADQLPSQHVRAVLLEPDGLAWIGTYDAGLCSMDLRAVLAGEQVLGDASVRCLDHRHGLVADSVHTVLPDGQGRLWMSSNLGIATVQREQLEAWRAGEQEQVRVLAFDERDGMANRETNGGHQPAAMRDSQGRLWFATMLGAAMVDPASIATPDGPPVTIEGFTVQQQAIDLPRAGGELHLTPAQRDIAVRWTAPALCKPEQLRFRYRLQGYDTAWRSALGVRGAEWTNLPPGRYQLQVEASKGGAWSPEPARLTVVRAPAFHESRLFPMGLVLLSALGATALFIGRDRRQRQRARELEGVIEARTAELHQRNRELQVRSEAIRAQAERLEMMDRQKARFVVSLSHELRTPLTLIAGPLDDLEDEPEQLGPRAREKLAGIRANTARLARLVDQLFDASRLNAGGVSLRARRLELNEFVRGLAMRFAERFGRAGLEFVVESPAGALPAWFDPDLLDKAISNLLDNAAKFTPAGGAVRLALELPGEHSDVPGDFAAIRVSDTGPGIPEAAQGHLFDLFYQVDGGDTRRHGGAGIGLALARELVELHGGELAVSSEPRHGSTFTILLPRGVEHLDVDEIDTSAPPPEDMAAAAPMPPLDEDGDRERPVVLVVEDHPDMRSYIVEHLRRSFVVLEAAHGVAGLNMARRESPDVIVSDVMMPEMDGITMCRELRDDPSTQTLPVILVSAKASLQARLEGLEIADDYLTKPFRMRELVARVWRLLQRKPPTEGEPEDAPTTEPHTEPPAPEQVDEGRDAIADLSPEQRRYRVKLDRFITEHVGDPQLGVDSLARHMAASRRTLLRDVKRVTGQSPSEYLRERRLRTAQELLCAGRVGSVGEAADAVGTTRSYFTRIYKARFGHPPSEDLR